MNSKQMMMNKIQMLNNSGVAAPSAVGTTKMVKKHKKKAVKKKVAKKVVKK